jgi:hypothetical protein
MRGEAMETQEAIRLLIGARHHCFVRGILQGDPANRDAFRDLNRLYVGLKMRLARQDSMASSPRRILRKGGRPRKYRNEHERRAANADYQRAFRSKKNPIAAD